MNTQICSSSSVHELTVMLQEQASASSTTTFLRNVQFLVLLSSLQAFSTAILPYLKTSLSWMTPSGLLGSMEQHPHGENLCCVSYAVHFLWTATLAKV